ncbi:MAG: NAD-dependent epimerase/dehydratase family protein [Reichenbachiella sp.]
MPLSLVTGGAGFIGSHIVDHLIANGHKVVVLDDLSGGSISNVPKEAIFIKGSITDVDLVNDTFNNHSFEYVFHFAAYAAEGLSHFIRNFNYQNNVIGSANLINASVNHNIKCFVFSSSIAVYGKNTLPMKEDTTPLPMDPYGIAKYAVELDLRSAKDLFGLNHIIFRPHNVYGEKQNLNDPYRNVIGIFINQILRNKPLTIFGNGKQTRAFSFIDDIAPVIASSINNEKAYNQTFNIGADHTYTVEEIASKVKKLMNSKLKVEYFNERHEVMHAHCDHHKLRTFFHIKEESTGLEEGLLKMVNWVKESMHNFAPTSPQLEIEKNLPESWKNNA